MRDHYDFPKMKARKNPYTKRLKEREVLLRDVNRGIEQLELGEGIPLDVKEIRKAIREKFAD